MCLGSSDDLKNTEKKLSALNALLWELLQSTRFPHTRKGDAAVRSPSSWAERFLSVTSRQMASFLHMLSGMVSLLSRLLGLAKHTSLPGVEAEDAVWRWHFIQLPLPLMLARRPGLCPPGDCCPWHPDARAHFASLFLDPCSKQSQHMPLFSVSLESKTRLPDCYLFKSGLCHFLAEAPWASYLMTVSLSLLAWEAGLIKAPVLLQWFKDWES